MGVKPDQLACLMVAELDARLREAGCVEVLDWPDQTDRTGQAIDLLAVDGSGVVAVEHTTIETWVGQLQVRKRLYELFPHGGVLLEDIPDAGHFHLVLDPEALVRLPWSQRAGLPSAVEQWVRATLPTVPWPHRRGVPTWVEGVVEPSRLRIGMERMTDSWNLVGPLARLVKIGWWIPAKLQQRRAARLQVALDAKVPKLLAAGADRSILVFEDRDMYASAPAFVSEALQAASAGRRLPDVVWLFNVTAGNPLATPVWDGSHWWHEHGPDVETFPRARCGEYDALRQLP